MWVLAGRYGSDGQAGGITVLRADGAGDMRAVSSGAEGLQAGYLVHSPGRATVYAVDERKTDGRGPVGPAAAVHALRFDARTGALERMASAPAHGPYPTYLDIDDRAGWLTCASHGSFDHVQQVVRTATGWETRLVYDHSTVALYALADGGGPALRDLVVLQGHGMDPNHSPQAGGHAQASAHAHCATIDPTGRFVVVCDKGTDTILTFRLGDRLEEVARFTFPPETAPRHVAFSADGLRLFVTLELASALAAMRFDRLTGGLELLAQVPTLAAPLARVNEPAELRLHPGGRWLYVNNRGEDTLACFEVLPEGGLAPRSRVPLAPSVHPGLAARSFAISPDGGWLFMADRPADLLRLYAVDAATGALRETATIGVHQPACVLLVPEE